MGGPTPEEGLQMQGSQRPWGPWSRLDTLIALVLAGALVIYLWPLLDLLMPGFEDEGDFVLMAHRLLQGQVPYVQVFAQFTPGGAWLVAGWLALVGDHLEMVRAFLLVASALTAVLLYGTAREVLSRGPALAAAAAWALSAVPTWPVLSHYWVAVPFVVASGWLLLRTLRGEGRSSGLLLGLALGGALATMQHFGLAVLAVSALLLFLEGPRRGRLLAGLLGGLSLAWLPLLLVLAWQGALGAMLDSTLFYSATTLRRFNQFPLTFFPFGTVFQGLQAVAGLTLPQVLAGWSEVLDFLTWPGLKLATFSLFFPSCLLFPVLAWREERAPGRPLLALALLQLALAGTVLYRPDESHVNFVRTFWWILATHFAFARPWRAGGVGIRVAAGVLALCLVTQAALKHRGWAEASFGVDFPRGRVRVPQEGYARMLEGLERELAARTAPGDPILVYPIFPMLYYLSDRVNPTPYPRLVPFLNREEQFERVRQAARRGEFKAVVILQIDYPSYLALYPKVDPGAFVEADRRFQRDLEEACGDRVLRWAP